MIFSPIDIAVIPNARSPRPGTNAINALHVAPLYLRPYFGPGTFDIINVALLTSHIIISCPIIPGRKETT